MPQNHTITIEAIEANDELKLSDRGKTDAGPGDTITWVIKNKSGVASITGIDAKPGSNEVFISPPTQIGGSTNWKGTIKNKDQFNGITTEDYTINYTKESGGAFSYDPKIQVNP